MGGMGGMGFDGGMGGMRQRKVQCHMGVQCRFDMSPHTSLTR